MNNPSLDVTMRAQLDQLGADFDKASSMADDAIDKINQKFAGLNPGVGDMFSGMAVALAGAAAGAYGLYQTFVQIKGQMAEIAQLAQYLNTTTDRVQAFQFAGTTAGVGGDQALKDLENVGRLLNDAQRNENSLTRLLDENNTAYKDREGHLISINDLLTKGANLVANAGSYADKTEIAKMLGLTQQWVPVLEKGGEAFNQIAQSAISSGNYIDQSTIQKAKAFDDAWKQSSAKLAANFKAALGDIAGWLDGLIEKANNPGKGSSVKSPADAQALANRYFDIGEILRRQENHEAQDPAMVQRALDNLVKSPNAEPWMIDFLRKLAPEAKVAAGALDQVTAAAARAAQAYHSPGADQALRNMPAPTGNGTSKVPAKKDDTEDAYDRQVQQIQKRTAEYQAETEAVGLNTEAKISMKAASDLLVAVDRAGIPLTQQRLDQINQLADAEGKAAQESANAAQKFQQTNQLIQFGGDSMIQVLDGVRTKSMTAQQAVLQLANSLITAMEKAVLLGQGPVAGLFGTAAAAGTGGTGGLLGAIFGGYRADGGAVTGGNAFVVGERGPEIFVPGNSGMIIPNDAATRSAVGGGSFHINVDLSGANGDQAIAEASRRAAYAGAGMALMQFNRGFPARQDSLDLLGS